jgi:PAS domain S-box-containing protein
MAIMSLPNGLRTLLERAHDVVLVTTTSEGQILFWNPGAERRFGYRARDVMGRPIGEILALDTASTPAAWQLQLPSGTDHTFEVRTRTRRGRTIWLDVTAFAADGPVPIVVYVARDVTRTRDLLRQLREHLVPNQDHPRLTPRELEVLRAFAAGLSTGALAERLGVSRATIRNHAQNIFGKLGAHTRLEAVMLATRRRLL